MLCTACTPLVFSLLIGSCVSWANLDGLEVLKRLAPTLALPRT